MRSGGAEGLAKLGMERPFRFFLWYGDKRRYDARWSRAGDAGLARRPVNPGAPTRSGSATATEGDHAWLRRRPPLLPLIAELRKWLAGGYCPLPAGVTLLIKPAEFETAELGSLFRRRTRQTRKNASR
jgi:hypothetical protein